MTFLTSGLKVYRNYCNLLIIVMLCILSNSNLFTLTFDSLPLDLFWAKLAADGPSSKSIGLMFERRQHVKICDVKICSDRSAVSRELPQGSVPGLSFTTFLLMICTSALQKLK